jgi:hypothetical protein
LSEAARSFVHAPEREKRKADPLELQLTPRKRPPENGANSSPCDGPAGAWTFAAKPSVAKPTTIKKRARASPEHRLRGLLLTNDLPGPRHILGAAFNRRQFSPHPENFDTAL